MAKKENILIEFNTIDFDLLITIIDGASYAILVGHYAQVYP
ncbi:hypothetical protein HCH_00606 [Hahella chejuensis KCTC 2396]|uniref:Uncharacterized protein n=1 Tax=Hahella chejuensis (strain KCTC 2396) TaxID=349521 RepID=Q2SPB5_HAHCH|nr:hypothetical protein HCH_00606 [Hahella chejuensis KCTC 2396]